MRLSVLLLLVLLLAPAAQAQTRTVTTNACVYESDGFPRDTEIELGGAFAPGSTTLSSGVIRVRIPAFVIQSGHNLGLLDEGDNRVPTRVWVALAATGGEPATVVHALRVDAVARVENGRAQPMDAQAPLPDTAFTAPAGGLSVRQAGPGSLGTLPVGPDGGSRAVAGSVYLSADVGDGLRINLDCQPGRQSARGEKTIVTAEAAPFAATTPGVVPPPAPAPVPADYAVPAAAALRLPSQRLRLRGRRIAVRVRCAGTVACRGRLRLVRRNVQLARSMVRLPAGRRATVRLALKRGDRRRLRRAGAWRARLLATVGDTTARRRVRVRAGQPQRRRAATAPARPPRR